MLRFLFVLLTGTILLNFAACDKTEPIFYNGLGKVPIYVPLDSLDNIYNLPPQTVTSSGPIFWKDSLFFMLEDRQGIHVFVLRDSSNSEAVTFLKIPAISDFTISGNRLYADSWRDLVTIDISDILQIKMLSRNKNVVQPQLYPLLYSGVFECIDESRGAVVGWVDSLLTNAQCITVN